MKLALSKTGRFLSKADILGVGVFPPLLKFKLCFVANLEPPSGNHDLQTLGNYEYPALVVGSL